MLLIVALVLLASEDVGSTKPSILAKGTRQLSTVELNAKLVNAVCTKVEGEPEACRFIFVDVDGLFWTGANKIYADQLRQIRFKKIEDR